MYVYIKIYIIYIIQILFHHLIVCHSTFCQPNQNPCSDAAGGVRAPGVATLRASSLSLAPSAAVTAEAPGETEAGDGFMGSDGIEIKNYCIIFHYIVILFDMFSIFHVLK